MECFLGAGTGISDHIMLVVWCSFTSPRRHRDLLYRDSIKCLAAYSIIYVFFFFFLFRVPYFRKTIDKSACMINREKKTLYLRVLVSLINGECLSSSAE